MHIHLPVLEVLYKLSPVLYALCSCLQDVREEVTETTTEAGDSVGFRRLIRSSTKKKGNVLNFV